MTDHEAAGLMRAMGHAHAFILAATGVDASFDPVDIAGYRTWRDVHRADRRELQRIVGRGWSSRADRHLGVVAA